MIGVEMVARRSRTNARKKRVVRGVAGRSMFAARAYGDRWRQQQRLYLLAIDKMVADTIVVSVGSWLEEPVELREKRIGDDR